MKQLDVVRWTARNLPGVDGALRAELAESAGLAADRAGPLRRALEVTSLVSFALRSMSRRGAGDDRVEMVRQGVRVGGLVLAVATALRAVAADHDAATVALAIGACLTAVAVAAGLRAGALVAAALTAAADLAVTGSPDGWSIVVVATVAAGHRFDARRCPLGGLVCAVGLAAGWVVAATTPAPTSFAIVGAAVAVAACLLLAIGWSDPRFAIAATVVWCSRFVPADAVDGRWLPALVGLGVGWAISHVALRRTLTLVR